eukprot:TRINITY_DN38878_c1_g1_i3.p2 TRINITY_DN38878_c1_g1~~TRINITY_DN38878_c1_g1_i3.p2  ORF type:complete len:237 (-),score=10.11 TRINITY_DN38878_c1_g1_i3:89-799(-)
MMHATKTQIKRIKALCYCKIQQQFKHRCKSTNLFKPVSQTKNPHNFIQAIKIQLRLVHFFSCNLSKISFIPFTKLLLHFIFFLYQLFYSENSQTNQNYLALNKFKILKYFKSNNIVKLKRKTLFFFLDKILTNFMKNIFGPILQKSYPKQLTKKKFPKRVHKFFNFNTIFSHIPLLILIKQTPLQFHHHQRHHHRNHHLTPLIMAFPSNSSSNSPYPYPQGYSQLCSAKKINPYRN